MVTRPEIILKLHMCQHRGGDQTVNTIEVRTRCPKEFPPLPAGRQCALMSVIPPVHIYAQFAEQRAFNPSCVSPKKATIVQKLVP